MNYQINKILPTKAKEILDFFKVVGRESDNLIFGKEGLGELEDAEEEKKFIQKFIDYPWYGSFLVAKNEKDEIIGSSFSHTHPRKRIKHCYDFEIVVLKKYQNQGIGTDLAKKTIKNLKENTYCKRLTAHSLTTESQALKFLKKLGFEIEGTMRKSIKIGNEYLDQYLLSLIF